MDDLTSPRCFRGDFDAGDFIMDFKTSVQTCLQKFVTFSGRAARPEYWWFQLFLLIAGFVLGVLSAALPSAIAWIATLASIALLVPGVAVTIRRLHDLDRTGWWLLIVFVPLIGLIVLFIFSLSRGTEGPNRFGDPVAV